MVGTAESCSSDAIHPLSTRFPTYGSKHRHLVYKPQDRYVIRSQCIKWESAHDKMDITSQPEKRIVARQMHKAILDYMNSDQFRPQFTVTPQQISELFTKTAGDIKSYTNDSPDELKPKIN